MYKYAFAVGIILPHWNATATSLRVNTTYPDDRMAMQGAKASAAVVLTYFTCKDLHTTQQGLTSGLNKMVNIQHMKLQNTFSG